MSAKIIKFYQTYAQNVHFLLAETEPKHYRSSTETLPKFHRSSTEVQSRPPRSTPEEAPNHTICSYCNDSFTERSRGEVALTIIGWEGSVTLT